MEYGGLYAGYERPERKDFMQFAFSLACCIIGNTPATGKAEKWDFKDDM